MRFLEEEQVCSRCSYNSDAMPVHDGVRKALSRFSTARPAELMRMLHKSLNARARNRNVRAAVDAHTAKSSASSQRSIYALARDTFADASFVGE
ncbi:hypothetical protein NLM27_23390 [Bradyrhizobium sp. CCGB12]|uniref:hypothetical protein n=1 Tax=Bradyrhizobium sp. CCGB12 TaxID=2949632 RepID=UPI0020B20C3C|nr:hypothetical protein [Bradyrhizobium sp. CCGB12]MCP3391739.1 hypothetical protein [Bradyrhizobium sp. CCGB12]